MNASTFTILRSQEQAFDLLAEALIGSQPVTLVLKSDRQEGGNVEAVARPDNGRDGQVTIEIPGGSLADFSFSQIRSIFVGE